MSQFDYLLIKFEPPRNNCPNNIFNFDIKNPIRFQNINFELIYKSYYTKEKFNHYKLEKTILNEEKLLKFSNYIKISQNDKPKLIFSAFKLNWLRQFPYKFTLEDLDELLLNLSRNRSYEFLIIDNLVKVDEFSIDGINFICLTYTIT